MSTNYLKIMVLEKVVHTNHNRKDIIFKKKIVLNAIAVIHCVCFSTWKDSMRAVLYASSRTQYIGEKDSHDCAMSSVWILAAESRWYPMESQHFDLEHWVTVSTDLELNHWIKDLRFMLAVTRWSKAHLKSGNWHADVAAVILKNNYLRGSERGD